ncbi:MAG: class IV adenylate cyclase [Pseudonocardiaceae bacterium]
MSIEAELKARLRDPGRIRALLRDRAREQVATYSDVYFDTVDHRMTAEGRELRIREISDDDGNRSVLTYKAPSVHAASGSKPEYETEVIRPDVMRIILDQLGYVVLVALTKHCRNYWFVSNGHDMLATLVHVPELDGTFLEVETIVSDKSETDAAITAVRAVLTDLGITDDDLTTEQYTAAVQQRRGQK